MHATGNTRRHRDVPHPRTTATSPAAGVAPGFLPRRRSTAVHRAGRLLVVLAVVFAGRAACAVPVSGPSMPTAVRSTTDELTDRQIDQAGDRVMQSGDFRSLRRRLQQPLPEADPDKGFLNSVADATGMLFGSLFTAVSDFFSWLFSSGPTRQGNTGQPTSDSQAGSPFALTGIGRLLTVLIIVAVLAVIVAIVAAAVRTHDRRRRTALLPDADEEALDNLSAPPGELGVSIYERRAQQLAEQGNYRSAIRELLLGAMSWIERRGSIRYRRGLTNRDYLRSVWRQTTIRNAFGTVALAFEQVYFGRRAATPEMYQHCLSAFQGVFRESEVVSSHV